MNMWTIYLLLKLDSFCEISKAFATGFSIVFVISIYLLVVSKFCPSGCFNTKLFKWPSIISGFVFFISILTFTVLPTTKQACAIYVIPKIANNEKIQNIGDKSLTLIEKKFEEWVNDFTKTETTNK